MTSSALHRTINRPLVAAMWGLTLVALVPFPSLACLLLGAAANLGANGIALYLICSRSHADRFHGVARLALQVAILVVGALVLARCGVNLEDLYRFATHRQS